VANAYYWHRFYAHQPDLNYDNPHVRQAILKVVVYGRFLGVKLPEACFACSEDGIVARRSAYRSPSHTVSLLMDHRLSHHVSPRGL
jgi:alpha amylase-like protein